MQETKLHLRKHELGRKKQKALNPNGYESEEMGKKAGVCIRRIPLNDWGRHNLVDF